MIFHSQEKNNCLIKIKMNFIMHTDVISLCEILPSFFIKTNTKKFFHRNKRITYYGAINKSNKFQIY